MIWSKYFERVAWLAKALWKDTSGIMLPYVTVMIFVLVGLSLLAVDGGRYMSLQTQMQAAADASALAGAAELDGKTGAIARATGAINGLFTNGLTGMGTTNSISSPALVFYSSLPPASQLPSSGTVATGDANAHFVSVTVTSTKSVPTIFPVSFLIPGGANSYTGGAQAVAGYGPPTFCGIPPVFICNPWEGSGTSLSDALSDPNKTRKEFKLLNDGTFGPGHFGWLVPPDGDVSASNLQSWISRTTPKACYSSNVANLNTGAKQSALNGFNVYFDIGADAGHAPDVNVRKGYVAPNTGNWCNASLDNNAAIPPTNNTRAMALPQDTSFPSGFMGNGQWDCATYWSFNHHNVNPPTVRANGSPGVCGTSTTTTLSRYDVYTYENNNPNLFTNWSRGTSANNYTPAPPYTNATGEIGTPSCAGNAVTNRRIIIVAVIDCLANAALIVTGGANALNVPVDAYAEFLMTQPVPTTGAASNRNLIGEFTGAEKKLGAHRLLEVQLYR